MAKPNSGDEVLWENKWLRVCERDGWYTFVQHPNDLGGVAVLIYDLSRGKILVRQEHTPCHGPGLRRTSLTGTIEPGSNPLETAVKETKEESGIAAEPEEFLDLGWVYPSKSSDFKQYLFALDATGKEMGEIEGDGTKGEEGAGVEWVSIDDALAVNDPSIGKSIALLMRSRKLESLGEGFGDQSGVDEFGIPR